MTRITPEQERAIWPEEYDPTLERITEKTELYWKVERPKRVNKPGRRLTFLTPQIPDIIATFGELKFSYLEEVEPYNQNGRPGDHYHHEKVELFCPDSKVPLFLCLKHLETGSKTVIVLKNTEWQNYTQYLILPKVVHTIVNPTATAVSYHIISNMSEVEALKVGDVVPQSLNLAEFSLPTTLKL